MNRVLPNDCIPGSFYISIAGIETARDLIYLGKENLTYLARFWKKRKKKFSEKLFSEKDSQKRDGIKLEIERCDARWEYLESIIPNSESKPAFFAKPVFKKGNRVACFVAEPDRYVVGTIVDITTEPIPGEKNEDLKMGTFIIRAYDRELGENYDLEYTPDGSLMFLADYLDYYRANPDYYRYMLYCLAAPSNPREIDYIERLVAALTI